MYHAVLHDYSWHMCGSIAYQNQQLPCCIEDIVSLWMGQEPIIIVGYISLYILTQTGIRYYEAQCHFTKHRALYMKYVGVYKDP